MAGRHGPGSVAGCWRVRPAREADLEELAVISAASLSEPWSYPALRQELALPGAWLWVAERTGPRAIAVGYLVARRGVGEVSIVSLAVGFATRRRGAGSALLRAVLARARELGTRAAFLEVRARNVPARRLYAQHGFLEVGRRPRYYPGGEDAVLMNLSLESSEAHAPRAGEAPR